MYTIGQVADMFGLPISTLRYYDKQGLFPGMERVSGIRKFGEREVETLRLIECLKKSGMEIKDIKQFIQWCQQGPATYERRRKLFAKQKESVEAEIAHLNKVLDMLKFKHWYYEQLVHGETEEQIKAMLPDRLPEEIQMAYDNAHGL